MTNMRVIEHRWLLNNTKNTGQQSTSSANTIDLNNTGSRIHMPQVKPVEMTNLEYQDGGQSAFSMDKKTSLF